MTSRTNERERGPRDRTDGDAGRLVSRLPGSLARIADAARGEDVLILAAGLAFYALVSLVPLVIFVLWITSLFLGDARVHRFSLEIQSVAPEKLEVGRFVERVADLGTSLGVPALLTALWPASSYGAGLRRAFERLSPRSKGKMKGLRGRGLTILVLLPLFVLGSLLGAYAGTALLGESVFLRIAGVVLGGVIGFAGAAAAVALIYRIFPPERMPWRSIWAGTLWAAATIALASVVFAIFIGVGADFEKHFATTGVAAVVLLGLWLLASNALLLIGYRIAQRR